jgi:hypothetical protein
MPVIIGVSSVIASRTVRRLTGIMVGTGPQAIVPAKFKF